MKKIISLISFKTRIITTFVLMFLIFNSCNLYALTYTFANTNGVSGTKYTEAGTHTFTNYSLIVINAGVEVDLTGTWKLDPGCKVTVSNQAFLYIKGGTVTRIIAGNPTYFSDYWGGIEVLSDVQTTSGHTSGIDETLLKTTNYFLNHWSTLTHGSLVMENNGGTRSVIQFSKAGCVSGEIDLLRQDGTKQVQSQAHFCGGFMYANQVDFFNNVLNSFAIGARNFECGYGPLYVQNCSLVFNITHPLIDANVKGGNNAFITVRNISYNTNGGSSTAALHSISNFYETHNGAFAINAYDLIYSRYDVIKSTNGIQIQHPNYRPGYITEVHDNQFNDISSNGLQLRSINNPHIYDNYFEDKTWAMNNFSSRNGIFYNNTFEIIHKAANVIGNTVGLVSVNCDKFPNIACYNTLTGLGHGMVWQGKDNSGYFTQCNTFTSQKTADLEITGGIFMNPHGSCGAYSMPNNFFTQNNANVKHILNKVSTNLTYVYGNTINGTKPDYISSYVTRTQCANFNWECTPPSNLMINTAPDSVLMTYNSFNTLISTLSAIDTPSTDQIDSINWLKWQRTSIEFIITKNYMSIGRSDSAISKLKNDTSFWARYILTNVYIDLGQDTNAEVVVAAYNGYSGSDSNIIDFVLLSTFHIAAKKSGNAVTYITSNENNLSSIASHGSSVAEEAKSLYN